MKFEKSVKKQRAHKGFHPYITGTGRIDDSKPIDLAEEIAPDIVIDGQPGYPIGNSIPLSIKFSKECGNTVYDVVADFSTEGKETIINQFKKIILSDHD